MFRRSFARHAERLYSKGGMHVSRAASGMRIMTCDNFGGGITGVGLFVLTGPRYEDVNSFGASAVLDSLLLKGNARVPQSELSHDLGLIGNNIRVANHRECMCFTVMAPRYHAEAALDILEAVALHPTEDPAVFEQGKALAAERLNVVNRDATRCCFEMIHQAAWQGQRLGQSTNPTVEQLNSLTMEQFHAFHRRFTQPSRAVLVGTGVSDHDAFVKLVEERVEFPAAGAENAPPEQRTKYTGGVKLEHITTAPDSVTKFAEKNLTHMGLCFNGVTMDSPDYYAVSVIQTLLGGGTSFSSGGPGKGMHTKLFREVINREGWIHGIECVTAWYRDAGLAGLYGQVEHQYAPQLQNMLIFHAATIPERVDDSHWEMAKNQLMSQLILLGETRDLYLEEAGKYLLLHDKLLLAQELLEGTQKLTLKDLQRVCDRMLQDPVTFVVYGNTKGVITDPAKITEHLHAVQRKARRGK